MAARLDTLDHVAITGRNEPAAFIRPRKDTKRPNHLDTPHFRALEVTLDLIDLDARIWANGFAAEEMPTNRLLTY